MRVLGFDTATTATTVALLDSDTGAEHERRDDPPAGSRPRHTQRLLALAAEVLAQSGIDWPGIDLVAVGTGPGTFTGIRIGVSTARALAAARGLPIVGVGTLQALAAGAATAAAARGRDPLAVLDARRREVFAAGWDAGSAAGPGAAPVLAPRALAPAALGRELAPGGPDGPRRWLAVGDGALAYRAVLEGAGVEVPVDEDPCHRVGAPMICRLALGLPPGAPDDVRPEYLRLPDAELTRRAAEAGAALAGEAVR